MGGISLKHISNILLSGFLFFGQYFDSTLTDLEYRPVKYRAGIHLDIPLPPLPLLTKEGSKLFVEDETLMDSMVGDTNFRPIQINYKIGLSQRLGDFEAIIMNECKHPVDGLSGGAVVQDYKLIELRYHFK